MAALVALLSLSACGSPCDSLADRICTCEPNANQERACLLRKDRAQNRAVSAEEADRCSMLLETCTCEALALDNFGACGIANPQPTP